MELKITALNIETIVELFGKSGGNVTAEMIEADIASGAPTNPDGTINLVSYAAWLIKEPSNHGN